MHLALINLDANKPHLIAMARSQLTAMSLSHRRAVLSLSTKLFMEGIKVNRYIANYKSCLRTVFTLICILITNTAMAEDPFWNALTQGKFDFSARYRFEHVNDDLAPGGIPLKDANASTIRTTLGYKTGKLYNIDARLLLQDVRVVGVDDFNDATGRANAKTQYAVVADPSDTDFIEGYLGFSGIPDTYIKAGRQIITYRDAPFHRFIGTVLWRQNWQNHDAISLTNTSLPDTTVNYAYVWNVNRIFTDRAATSALANFHSNSHLVNIKYTGLPIGQLEGYTYLLDFQNSLANSLATYGLRLNGGIPATKNIKAIYTAEYAKQYDYADNPTKVNENYFLGELGAVFKLTGPIDSILMKFSYEQLSGNGTTSFRTPLATGHAFQGWTDRFLVTPADGIKDYYLTAVVSAFGAKFIASYHDINSDNLDYNFGNELDILLSKTFYKHYTAGLKYGAYNADKNVNNAAGGTAADVAKFWGWVEVKF